MNVQPDLTNHPKFKRLKRRVGDIAMECLIRLWGHCQANRRGELWPGVDAEYVEVVCEWTGTAGALYPVLVECRWVDEVEGGIRIHGWDDANSRLLNSWENGRHGGRKPKANRAETRGLPVATPQRTDRGPRSDQTRLEETREGSRAAAESGGGSGTGAKPTPTLQEVLAVATMRGIPDKVARAYWHDRDEVGWQRKGENIRNWESGLQKYWTTWRANDEQRRLQSGGSGRVASGDEQALRAEMQTCNDPVRRKEIRRLLEAMA